jgi:hypothetical protein
MSKGIGTWAVKIAVAAALSPFAAVYLAFLALVWLWRATARLAALSDALSDVRYCGRGHANDVAGRWRCKSCSALWEGVWWTECVNCGATAGYHPCTHEGCGLMVTSPMVRR